ncbi:hypothetical protein VNO78_24353 [Psophocarpus tetragonolobus]|uniref:RING-type domain-containing protein n=1 Tax=Psophocarpus tetragonolobus TaxID=3891 RepID=A0AAN9S5V0_PSOTE
MEGRRRITLYDQMTTTGNSSNSGSSSRDSLARLMLDDGVFNKAKAKPEAEPSRNRTLQDIIREEKPNGDAKDRVNNNSSSNNNNNSWRAFKERLRLKRGAAIGSAWSSFNSTAHHNNHNKNDADDDDYDGNNNLPEIRHDSSASAAASDDVVSSSAVEIAAAGDSSEGENNHEAVVGVSLMDLLEEAEQEMDLYRAVVSDNGDDVAEENGKREEENENENEEKQEGAIEYNCCVCMVRHKGAAFIPCGHTFCRMCSREIWVSRGNCPLCNNLILEILDIF